MWQRVGDGVYAVMGVDGLPVGLATALDDGTPLKVADQWWALGRRLTEWAGSDEAREMIERSRGEPGEDAGS